MRRTSRRVALSLLVVGLLTARAHALVITTALGNGADTFINGDGATYRRGENNYGGGSTMTCRRSSGDYTRKGYVRFDVGGIHASDPTLKVTVSSVSSQGGSPTTMNVWALNDGYPGVDNSSPTNGSVNDDEDTHDEFWPERVIDWFSAPGNLGNTTMDPASTTLLGTFTVPLGAPKYTTLSFNDPALTALVNNDTNGVITLAMQPAATSAYVYLYTKEGTSTTAYRPQLVVQTAALTWDGEGGANKNWSHAPNWDADGLPTDSATFNNTATAAAGTVTNIVDEDFTVGTLTYEHTGAGASDYHTTQINSGQTLRAYGSSGGNAMVVGTTATDGVTTRVAFVGEGTLNIDNPSADFLMTGYHHAGGVSRSTLAVDMSGLATFHATVDDFLAPGGFINANSQLTLAQTSSITADGVAFAAWGGAAGGTNFVHLGQTNTLHTNKLVISGGRASSTTEFTPGLPGTPTVEIRGKAGGSSRADLWVADQNGNGGYGRGGSNRATGVADFTAGSIDALLDVAIIGRNGAVASRRPGAATGTLSFDEGTIDANSIILARTPALPNTNLVDYKTANQGHTYGTLNMGGGTLLAGSMAIAEVQGHGTPVNASGRDLSTRATGTLNISGGSATVTGDVTLAHHTSTGTATATGIIDVTGGSLTILGDLYEGAGGATSVSTVTVSGGTLSVGDAGVGSIAVDTVNLGSPGGTLSLCGLNPAEGNHAIDDYNHGAGGTLDLRVNAFGTGTIVATTADFAAGSLVSVSPVTAAPGGSTADQSAWVGSTGTWDATHSPWSNGNPAGFAIPTSSTFQFMQAGTLTDSGVALDPASDVDWDLNVVPGSSGTATLVLTGGAIGSGPIRAVIDDAASAVTRTGDLRIAPIVGADASELDMTDGTLAVNGSVDATGGKVHVYGGTMTVTGSLQADDLAIGAGAGTATVDLTSTTGTHAVANDIAMAAGAASSGTLSMAGGTFAVGGSITDGGGTSALNVLGGTMTVAGSLQADDLAIGAGTATATVDLTSTTGTHAVANDIAMAAGATSSGTLSMAGGTLAVGGSITDGGGTSTLHVDSGALTVAGDLKVDSLRVGWNGGTGSVTAGGDVVVGASGILDIGRGATGTGDTTGILDLGGATSFTADLDQFRIGTGSVRALGQVTLAATNTITAGAIAVGSNTYGGTSGHYLRLGQTNTVHTDKIVVGGARASATLEFASGLSGTPTVEIRGTAGGTSRADMWLGDQAGAGGYGTGGSSTASGTANFIGGELDAMFGTLIVGRNGWRASGVPGAANGTLSFDQGTLDATEIILARTPLLASSGLHNYTDPNRGHTYGTLNMDGGTLEAGSMTLGEVQGQAVSGDPPPLSRSTRATGRFNLSGGIATVRGNVTLGHHTSTGPSEATGIIHMTGGSLDVQGHLVEGAGGPISVSTVNVDSGALTVGGDLKVDSLRVGYNGGTGSASAGGDVAIGASGTLNIGVRDDGQATGTTAGTLDLRNADSVQLDLDNLRLGITDREKARGELLLSSATNTIHATAITAGDSSSAYQDDPGDESRIELNGDTEILADRLYVGMLRSRGIVEFGTSGGTLTLGSESNPVADLRLGYNGGGTSSFANGELDLSGGSIDAYVGQMVLGNHGGPYKTGTGGGTGTLRIADGTFRADSIVLGLATTGTYGPGNATGIIHFSGGTLSAGSITQGASGGNSTAIFDWTGGTLHVDDFGLALANPAGTLAPGRSIGTTDIRGSYTQGENATLEIEIDGALHDLVTVSALATLDGILKVEFLGSPVVGGLYDVLVAEEGIDDRGMVLQYDDPMHMYYSIVNRPDVGDRAQAVRLHYTPEPATMTLLGLPLALLARRRRRK